MWIGGVSGACSLTVGAAAGACAWLAAAFLACFFLEAIVLLYDENCLLLKSFFLRLCCGSFWFTKGRGVGVLLVACGGCGFELAFNGKNAVKVTAFLPLKYDPLVLSGEGRFCAQHWLGMWRACKKLLL